MKKLSILCAAAAAILGLASCNQMEGPSASEAIAGLNVRIVAPGAAQTKAVTDVIGNEAKLNNVTVFLFDGNGNLMADGKKAATVSGEGASCTFDRVRVGTYQLAAVANFGAATNDPFANVTTLRALNAIATDLGDNNPNSGFVMAGSGSVAVNPTSGNDTPNTAELKISRLVSRIRLVSVENKLPAAYTDFQVDQVFVINGNNAWNLGGEGNPTGYFNWAGRTQGNNNKAGNWDDATNYIVKTQSDMQYAALAYNAPVKAVAAGATEPFNLPFYTLQNTGTEDHFNGPTDGAVKTRLVLRASYGGSVYFYPVTIDKVERNKSYDVLYTISGPGTKDPNEEVSKGNLTVNVIVDPWGDGGDPIVGEF